MDKVTAAENMKVLFGILDGQDINVPTNRELIEWMRGDGEVEGQVNRLASILAIGTIILESNMTLLQHHIDTLMEFVEMVERGQRMQGQRRES